MQAALGEVVAWRTLIWAMTTAMAADPQPGPGGTVDPEARVRRHAARSSARSAWPAVKEIFENVLGGSPLVVPSSREDLVKRGAAPAHRPLLPRLERHRRSSGSSSSSCVWDAIGTEFGGRHELYERNYAGNHEQIRLDVVNFARRRGGLEQWTPSSTSVWPITTSTAGPATPGFDARS